MKTIFCLIPALILVFLSMQGCGKKADPRCPSAAFPLTVSGLSVEKNGECLRVKGILSGDADRRDRFRISRSSMNRSREICTVCPRDVPCIAEIPRGESRLHSDGEGEGHYACDDTAVDTGYRSIDQVGFYCAAERCDDRPGSADDGSEKGMTQNRRG